MDSLTTLLQKFKDGLLSEEEKLRLLQELSTNEPGIREWLEKEYQQDIAARTILISEKRSAEIFEQIQQKKAPAVDRGKIVWLPWLSAACLTGLVLLGVFYYRSVSSGTKNLAGTPVRRQVKQLVNNSGKVMEQALEDGSVVVLEPSSALSYYQPFGSRRDISLRGTADFKVAQEKGRPFTIYAGGIATTALGTEFSVAVSDKKVLVQLLEGKVVVRSADTSLSVQDIYLRPGQQVSIDGRTGIYALGNFKAAGKERSNGGGHKEKQEGPPAGKEAYALTFNKTPLSDVFDQIGNKYGIRIQYNKNELGRLSFTGSFLATDSLKTILNLIVYPNDLSFKEEKGIIIITR